MKTLRMCELSRNQKRILWALTRLQIERGELEGITVREIAEATWLSYSTVKNNLSKLAQMQVIERHVTFSRGRAYRYVVLIAIPDGGAFYVNYALPSLA